MPGSLPAGSVETTDTPKSILRELVMHFAYDAGVNGSKFTDAPQGGLVLSISDDSLFVRAVRARGKGVEAELLQELLNRLMSSIFYSGGVPVGTLMLQEIDGSLWQRISALFDSPPDVIADIVAPILYRSQGQT